MELKYQFNKISLQFLRKQLAVRERALPILKSKESALRLTVKRYKNQLQDLIEKYNKEIQALNNFKRLWAEFPHEIFSLKEVLLHNVKIAGVKVPVLDDIVYDIRDYSRFLNPAWITFGVELLKITGELVIQIKITEKSISLLDYARKKTTQKVNLYEKVQIPQYSEAILKIKRFLEDVENLEKSAQKITKNRQYAVQMEMNEQ